MHEVVSSPLPKFTFHSLFPITESKQAFQITILRKKTQGGNMVYLKDSKIKVTSAGEVAKVFQNLLVLEDSIDREKEHYYVMHLDTRSQVKMVELITIGLLNSSLVHPRETFRRAVIAGSAAIIIAHNHPSGKVDPSEEDTKITRAMHDAGNILGIAMLDHIIFTKDNYYSFKSNGGGENI
jgi:DNA repair protein RadC